MPSFEANLQNVQQRIGRRLSGQEIRLLQMWDSVTQTDSRDSSAGSSEPVEGAEENELQYEGRFKIAFTAGHYEVFFVSASVRFRAVAIDSRDDVMAFLTQPPIQIDEILVKQALAAAETLRPTQINQAVTVPDVVLRSMGFQA